MAQGVEQQTTETWDVEKPDVENRMPTRPAAMIFRGKALLLQLRRGAQDSLSGIHRYACVVSDKGKAANCSDAEGKITAELTRIIAESRTPLFTEESPAERLLQWGKVQNLRCALRHLNGMQIPAGGTFSFWKQVGRATRARGYVAGRQLQEGCLFPAIGGGLCQLSNALYDIALQAHCEILERHPHTRIVPGSAAAQDRDAAIAWNYIDLRFRSTVPLCLEVVLTHKELIARLKTTADVERDILRSVAGPVPVISLAAPADRRTLLNVQNHSCVTCGVEACFRHDTADVQALRAQTAYAKTVLHTAYLVDTFQPEFATYLQERHDAERCCFCPLTAHAGKQRVTPGRRRGLNAFTPLLC